MQVVPLDARQVLVPWTPPGTITVSFTLAEVSGTGDLKLSLSEVEGGTGALSQGPILPKKTPHKHVLKPLNTIFFRYNLFHRSSKAADITGRNIFPFRCDAGYTGQHCEKKDYSVLYVVPGPVRFQYVLIAAVIGTIQIAIICVVVLCITRSVSLMLCNRRRKSFWFSSFVH